tara:strand:+ start:219 stop:527 length:309 start_codon:yes stop_codon:yes gene_type:complete
MNEHIMKVPFNIDKLSPENQLVIVRLVNHLASSGEGYRENVIERIEKINNENCMTFFEDDDFIEDNYMKIEKGRYGVGKTAKEIEEELEFEEEVGKKLKRIK